MVLNPTQSRINRLCYDDPLSSEDVRSFLTGCENQLYSNFSDQRDSSQLSSSLSQLAERMKTSLVDQDLIVKVTDISASLARPSLPLEIWMMIFEILLEGKSPHSTDVEFASYFERWRQTIPTAGSVNKFFRHILLHHMTPYVEGGSNELDIHYRLESNLQKKMMGLAAVFQFKKVRIQLDSCLLTELARKTNTVQTLIVPYKGFLNTPEEDIKRFIHLRDLELTVALISDEVIDRLLSLTKLEVLTASKRSDDLVTYMPYLLTDKGAKKLAKHKKIKKLTLAVGSTNTGTPAFTDKGIRNLSKLKCLEELEITWVRTSRLKKKDVDSLLELKRLETLRLSTSEIVSEKVMTKLGELANLAMLKLDRLSGAAANQLGKFVQLRTIDIQKIEGKFNLSCLKDLTNLTKLMIWEYSDLVDEDLGCLSSLKRLQALALSSFSNITPTGLDKLKSLSELEELVILDYREDLHTRWLIGHLSEMPKLRTLGLKGTAITSPDLLEVCCSHRGLKTLTCSNDYRDQTTNAVDKNASDLHITYYWP